MISLQDREWEDFYVLDYFDVNKYPGSENNMAALLPGETPLISAKKTGNGLKAFVTANPAKIKPAGVVTWNKDGDGGAGLAYYQPFEFVVDSHVFVLSPRQQLNAKACIFVSTLLSRFYGFFGHGRANSLSRIKKTRIPLPITVDNEPDWKFMVDYIEEREQFLIRAYLKDIEDISGCQSVPSLDQKEWRLFSIEELFTREPGKGKGLNHLTQVENGVSYLGATNRNNAVMCFVEPEPDMIQKGNGIAFIRNGEGSMGYSVYKEEPFIASSDITIGYNDNLDRYNGIFITTIADQVRGKYNFNYKRSDSRLAKETIQLPVTEAGEPDWSYMTQYIQAMMSKQKAAYVEFLNSKKL